MKARWKILLGLLALAIVGGVIALSSGRGVRAAAEQTRAELRKQGFKTDLSDFESGETEEIRERVAAMGLNGQMRPRIMALTGLDLMAPADERSAVVVWQQAKLAGPRVRVQFTQMNGEDGTVDLWTEISNQLGERDEELDAAAAAIFSGPFRIHLNYSGGNRMLLPHLAGLRGLSDAFATRTILALHDNNRDATWTNLLAATRLVTAWDIEPVEISQNIRLYMLETDYKLTWQALQAHDWPEERLAQLQREWESLDLFKGLPDVVAFLGASDVETCRQERERRPTSGAPMVGTPAINPLKSPKQAFNEWMRRWQEKRYLSHGTYVDERDMLLFYRERVKEMQRTVQSKTWAEMRELPGVTNQIFFQSRYTNRFSTARSISQTRRIATMMQSRGLGVATLAGRTAEAEARRRVMIAAIALERFRVRHGTYPETLAELTPEFLKAELVDFMDGKPLRYAATEDGHFFLYSVGLSCVDDGGKMPTEEETNPALALLRRRTRGGAGAARASDIVWPEPATDAAVAKMEEEKQREAERQKEEMERRQAEQDARVEIARQATVKLLLSDPKYKKATWSGAESARREPTYKGSALGKILCNRTAQDTNGVSLDELMSLKQLVSTEPGMAIYELPIKYEMMTNEMEFHLALLIDNPPDDSELDEPSLTACQRGTNGNCVLYWNTAYEQPGQHALQAHLMIMQGMDKQPLTIKGPVTPYYSSNLCRFEEFYANFDDNKAFLHADLAEPAAEYTIEIKTRAGAHVKTFTGSTTNGVIHVKWDLVGDDGKKITKNFFESFYTVKMTQSGHSQTMKQAQAKAGTTGDDQ